MSAFSWGVWEFGGQVGASSSLELEDDDVLFGLIEAGSALNRNVGVSQWSLELRANGSLRHPDQWHTEQ